MDRETAKQYGRELTIEDVKIKDGKDSNKVENGLDNSHK